MRRNDAFVTGRRAPERNDRLAQLTILTLSTDCDLHHIGTAANCSGVLPLRRSADRFEAQTCTRANEIQTDRIVRLEQQIGRSRIEFHAAHALYPTVTHKHDAIDRIALAKQDVVL